MNNDLISRKALKREITIECNPYGAPTIDYKSGLRVLEIIDRAPTVDGWVPLTTRELTPKEKRVLSIRYGDAIGNGMRKLVCQLPEDGQKVLITTAWGDVVIDIFHADPDGVYFEDHEDMDEVIAWRPLIEPYKNETF